MKKSALLVAIDRYEHLDGPRPLRYCVADAEAVAEALARCGFETQILRNEEATQRGIQAALRARRYPDTVDDIFAFGVFAHGMHQKLGGSERRFFLPHDATIGMSGSFIDRDGLVEDLRNIPASLRLGIFDACRNEPTRDGVELPAEIMLSGSRSLGVGGSRSTTFLLDACTAEQQAYESSTYRHGYFSHFLVEGINNRERAPERISGWTDDGLDIVHLATELRGIVAREVKAREGAEQTVDFGYDDHTVPLRLIIATLADPPVSPPAHPEAPMPPPPAEPKPAGPGGGPASGAATPIDEPAPVPPDPTPEEPPVAPPAEAPSRPRPALLAVLAGFAAAAVAAVYLLLPAGPAAATCGAARAPQGLVVLLDNRQGQLTAEARGKVTGELLALRDRMPEGALVELRRVDPADEAGRLLYSTCKPGPTAGPAAAFEAAWDDVLAGALADTAAPATAADAPLVATLRRVALDRFGRGPDRTRWLVLVSDLREHTPLFSLRGGAADFAAFEQSRLAGRYPADLGHVDLQVLVLNAGLSGAERAALYAFWDRWMTRAGVPFDPPIDTFVLTAKEQ